MEDSSVAKELATQHEDLNLFPSTLVKAGIVLGHSPADMGEALTLPATRLAESESSRCNENFASKHKAESGSGGHRTTTSGLHVYIMCRHVRSHTPMQIYTLHTQRKSTSSYKRKSFKHTNAMTFLQSNIPGLYQVTYMH